ncbi:transcription elongation factor 1 like protein [Quercus suber]|uniref:Transcription elongation factor 1 homolog n=1 Tax=Quercus suber TaxID=58331 RepID=A0AAW0L659_QUESU
MGKRKSRAKPPPKKRMDKLDTVFSCPFCNHGTSVECPSIKDLSRSLSFSFLFTGNCGRT